MSYTQILKEQIDDIVLLTLHRPEKLNAWTRTMNLELEDAIEAANDDLSVGAIVVTGAGRGWPKGARCSRAGIRHAGAQGGCPGVSREAPGPVS